MTFIKTEANSDCTREAYHGHFRLHQRNKPAMVTVWVLHEMSPNEDHAVTIFLDHSWTGSFVLERAAPCTINNVHFYLTEADNVQINSQEHPVFCDCVYLWIVKAN